MLDALRSSVSRDRLQRYEAMASGDVAYAFELYTWNTALSEALYGPLQGLEVTLRNKVHDRLSSQLGPQWYDVAAAGLVHAQQCQLRRAKESLHEQGKPAAPPRVIAELSFGFWVGLFGRRYETHLWRPHLRTLFANAPNPLLRQDAHKALNTIRMLRNRIAHHESIVQGPLQEQHELIRVVLAWLCGATAAWVVHHSRFDLVYSARP